MPKYIPFFGCMISVKYPQFEAAVRRTAPLLDMELVDIPGFSCCPDPIFFKAADKMTWLTLGARNLALVEQHGLDVITCCSGCTATLSEVHHILADDEALKARVNERLARIKMEYQGTSKVRHIVTVLRDEVGLDQVKASVKFPLQGLKVALHYGCHLLKPSLVMQVDDPDRPTILEDLFCAIGVSALEHEEKVLCCGKACHHPEMPLNMTYDVLKAIQKLEADCMGLICPTCFDEYDLGQLKLGRVFNEKFEIPIIYYFQLLGLAQGFTPQEMGLHRHKIKSQEFMDKLTHVVAAAPSCR
jgi:heterodisulfide reductase subunit B